MPTRSLQVPDVSRLLRRLFSLTLLALTPFTLANAASADTSWPDRVERYAQFTDFGSMVKGGTASPHWMSDGHRFWYRVPADEGSSFLLVDAKTGSREPFFDEERLTKKLTGLLGGESLSSGLPFDAFTLGEDESSAEFSVGERAFRLDLDSYELTEATKETEADSGAVEAQSPDGKWVLIAKEHNLWVRGADSSESVQLTEDGKEDHPWTLDELFWAADSDRLALLRYDSCEVHKVPVVKWLPDQEEVEWAPYPFARDGDARTEIYIVDLAHKKVTAVEEGGKTYEYQLVVGWRKDDAELLFLRFGAGMKTLSLMAADPSTGKPRTIVKDEQDTFIEGLHISLTYDTFHYPLPDAQHFIWRSERDGWTHFYLYRYDGKLVRRLTDGEFEVHKVLGVDEGSDQVYFEGQADPRNPYDKHLYQVSLQARGMKQLTEAEGTHNVTLCPDLGCFVDNHSSMSRAPVAELRRMDGSLVKVLERADVSRLEAMGWQPPEEFVVKAADGKTDLYGLLYKPHDLDPKKKYPVVNLIYGGSWAPAVPHAFTSGETAQLAQVLAQLNFVTFMVDARGTPGRGKAFQDVIYGNIGRTEIPDNVATLLQLAAERPYMDLERVGIHGKSWGGYFALRAMLQAPDVYHVGVASGIVADLSAAGSMSIAPYMGPWGENPEGYEFSNCLPMADKLKGKLLLTIATADVNTPFSQTMRMVEAFIKARKPVDLMLFPDQHHWLQGESMTYFYDVLRDYFVEHLEPEGSVR